MKYPLIKVLACTACSLLTRASICAQEMKPRENFDPGKIDSYLAAQVREKGRVGLSVAIVTNGQLALAKGYGSRSLREQLPVEPDTLFAIGSVTKQFTCACVLLLAQDGKLAVHDHVSKYFPKLARAANITLLDLSDEKLGGAAQRLKPLGPPKSAEVLRIRERGGLEVTTTSLSFEKKHVEVLMYRSPDGKIEQFFIDEK